MAKIAANRVTSKNFAKNNTGIGRVPNKLTTKPPSGKALYNIPTVQKVGGR